MIFFSYGAPFITGCAERVEDIDRTQPNKIRKSAFDGEWYFRQTVVDINGTGYSTFVALEGDNERVTFEFTEDSLIARRAHEDVPGIDAPAANIDPGLAQAAAFGKADGAPVVAFGVSHLDVIRNYNSSTGEQSNVIVENTQDRPWFERDWVRVTWEDSKGALPGWSSFLDFRGNEQEMANTPGSYQPPQDSTEDPDWYIECQLPGKQELVDCEEPGAEVTYIDVTYTVFRQPTFQHCFTNFFSVPGLFYADCGAERIKMRSSFAKLRNLDTHGECADCDQTFTMQNDYIPRQYDDFDDKRFGFFRMNRALFDRRWGLRDENTRQLAQLRAIWHRYTDGEGNELPYHERTPKPIVYYVNDDHPFDLLDEMALISDDYDMAFRRIIFALSNTSGGGEKYARIDDVPRMFYICSNPGPAKGEIEEIPEQEQQRLEQLGEEFAEDLKNLKAFYAQSNQGYSEGHCDRPGMTKNMGDVRYSFFNFINVPNQSGPLGYGPSSADPISGELINGTSNAYGAAIDYYAQFLLDLINIVHGDIEPADVGYGRNLKPYFDDQRARYQRGNLEMSVDAEANAMEADEALSYEALKVRNSRKKLDKLRKVAEEKLNDPRVRMVLDSDNEFIQLRNDFQRNPSKAFQNTSVEQKLIFPEIIKAAESGQLGPLASESDGESGSFGMADTSNEAILSKISPLRDLNVRNISKQNKLRDAQLIAKRIHMAEDFFDPKFMGWAREGQRLKDSLRGQGLSEQEVQEAMWYWVRGKSYLGLQEHEVGHSLGLRHNFAGSRDALNFFPEYWSLRQQSFKPDCDGQGYRTFDSTGLATQQVAPGTCDQNATDEAHGQVFRNMQEGLDPNRNLEFDAGLETYATASIMEYGATFGLNDQAGLGMYDYAALAYGYGDLVEVFNQAPNKMHIKDHFDADGDYVQFDSSISRSEELVTDMYDIDIHDHYNVGVLDPDQPIEADRERHGYKGFRDNGWDYWHYSIIPLMFWDENQEPTEEQTKALHLSPRIKFDGIGAMWRLYDRSLIPRTQAEAENKLQVPYKYCEDLFAGASTYDCMRWDTGADNLEVLTTIIERYNNYHPVNDFRRGRLTFGLYYSFARIVDRTFGRALRAYQFWLLNASSRGFNWYSKELGGYNEILAAIDGINFLGGILTRPSVGTYAYSNREGLSLNFDTEGQGVGPAGLSSSDEAEWDFSDGNLFTLDLSNGARFQFDQFVEKENGDRPYYFPFMMETFSHFWHKIFAMQMLVEGSIDVLGSDTTSNNTSFFIQPTLVFQDEIFRYFAGIVNEDFDRYIGICLKTDDEGKVLTRGNGDTRAVSWKPIDMIHNPGEHPCNEPGDDNWQLANPYTRAYGNADFNMRYFSTYLGAVGFLGFQDYNWIDTAGLYIKGRAETPDLSDELRDTFEAWEFTDTIGISNGMTYLAYCPIDYVPGDSETPRPGCDLINRMNLQADKLQMRRIEEAIEAGDLRERDVGPDPLNPTNPDRVRQVLATSTYQPTSFSEYYDLQNHQEMARFHLEILKRIY